MKQNDEMMKAVFMISLIMELPKTFRLEYLIYRSIEFLASWYHFSLMHWNVRVFHKQNWMVPKKKKWQESVAGHSFKPDKKMKYKFLWMWQNNLRGREIFYFKLKGEAFIFQTTLRRLQLLLCVCEHCVVNMYWGSTFLVYWWIMAMASLWPWPQLLYSSRIQHKCLNKQ